MDIDVRKYIINNFKDDSIEDLNDSINLSIDSKEEDVLIGLGVLFELCWENSSQEQKNDILKHIKTGLSKNVT